MRETGLFLVHLAEYGMPGHKIYIAADNAREAIERGIQACKTDLNKGYSEECCRQVRRMDFDIWIPELKR